MIGNLPICLFFGFFSVGEALEMPRDGFDGSNAVG
jgi:hypothetical protein